MAHPHPSSTSALQSYKVAPDQNSISGLSSGAFMTVQLHLAYSSRFIGAGVNFLIAGAVAAVLLGKYLAVY